MSLWGGDASFHNLDLRLEVLEQELHLPLSFISGHIHDLIIHVTWTKLASEPITITINTIGMIHNNFLNKQRCNDIVMIIYIPPIYPIKGGRVKTK